MKIVLIIVLLFALIIIFIYPKRMIVESGNYSNCFGYDTHSIIPGQPDKITQKCFGFFF